MKFNYKAFTSLLLSWCFLVLLISGIVLFIAPPGRIANWTDWSIWGLTKSKWIGIHNLTALTFLIAGFFHLLKFNWALFWHYLRRMRPRTSSFSWEVAVSLVLMLVLIAGTLFELQPFSGFLAMGESAKNSWEDARQAPPLAHMEMLSVGEVATRLSIPVEKALSTLAQAGLSVQNPEQKLRDLADRSGKSPLDIYNLLQSQPTNKAVNSTVSGESQHSVGGGLGQKTIGDAAKELGLTAEQALEALKLQGIETSAEEKVRDLADRVGQRPFDVVEIMRNYKK